MKSHNLAEAFSSLLSFPANSKNVITNFSSRLLLAQRILSILAVLVHYFHVFYPGALKPFSVHFLSVIANITIQISPYSGIFSILGDEILSIELAFQESLALHVVEHTQNFICFVPIDEELLHL